MLLLLTSVVGAQSEPADRLMQEVRSALAPALPFPASDDDGAVPANGDTEALWMVRPFQPGDRAIEVIANPLNEVNQQRAARAMAQIERNIEAAQRRAAAQYDRAVAEAKRTGRSQEVDGVTLSDEGVAGEKIDADSHVAIEVAFNQPGYSFDISSSVPPAPSTQPAIPGAVSVIAVPANIYRDERLGADRYAEAETLVFLGRLATAEVQRRADSAFAVTAAASTAEGGAMATIVLRLRGNEALIADLIRNANWTVLLELMK